MGFIKQQVNMWFEFRAWLYKLNLGTFFFSFNFCGSQDTESGKNGMREEK
jgi:hypothetical protein